MMPPDPPLPCAPGPAATPRPRPSSHPAFHPAGPADVPSRCVAARAPQTQAATASAASGSAFLPAASPPQTTLLEALDRVLDTGAVADGQIVLSLAGVDLVFIGVRALLASVETAARMGARP